jgi:hypothetical protein
MMDVTVLPASENPDKQSIEATFSEMLGFDFKIGPGGSDVHGVRHSYGDMHTVLARFLGYREVDIRSQYAEPS